MRVHRGPQQHRIWTYTQVVNAPHIDQIARVFVWSSNISTGWVGMSPTIHGQRGEERRGSRVLCTCLYPLIKLQTSDKCPLLHTNPHAQKRERDNERKKNSSQLSMSGGEQHFSQVLQGRYRQSCHVQGGTGWNRVEQGGTGWNRMEQGGAFTLFRQPLRSNTKKQPVRENLTLVSRRMPKEEHVSHSSSCWETANCLINYYY